MRLIRKPAPAPEPPKVEAVPKGASVEDRLARLEKNERHVVKRTAEVFSDFDERLRAVATEKPAPSLSVRITSRDGDGRLHAFAVDGGPNPITGTVTKRDADGRLEAFDLKPGA